MGYAILMQWTPATPPGRTSISDLVLSRVLEHYNITHPLRSTIQFRTFRAAFPTSSSSSSDPTSPPAGAAQAANAHIRLLTTITYSQPIPPVREVAMPPGARDDITYLFLEDRGVPLPGAEGAAGGVKEGEQAKEAEKGDKGEKDGDKKDGGKDGDKDGGKDGDKDGDKDAAQDKTDKDGKDETKENKDDKAETVAADNKVQDLTKDTGDDKKDTLSDDGFEIIEPPANGASASGTGNGNGGGTTVTTADKTSSSTSKAPASRRARSRYQILAVKPATLVMPTLHNLLSPFVLGLSKSARAQASTTGASTGAPTPLAGSPLVLTSLAFPPTAHPQPAIGLSVHMLPNAGAATIFLEAEWEGAWGGPVQGEDGARGERPGSGGYGVGVRGAAAVLREFLLGCVPEGVQGDARFSEWSGDDEGWSGPEKTRRMTSLLARALRESAFI